MYIDKLPLVFLGIGYSCNLMKLDELKFSESNWLTRLLWIVIGGNSCQVNFFGLSNSSYLRNYRGVV